MTSLWFCIDLYRAIGAYVALVAVGEKGHR